MTKHDLKFMFLGMIVAYALLSSRHPTQMDVEQLNCMAHAVYHEARGETEQGQIAVAYVVKNRSSTEKSLCDVVYEKNQFTDIKKTRPDVTSKSWKDALRVANTVLYSKIQDPTKGAKYFYAPKKVKTPSWAKGNFYIATTIGNHKFYVVK